MKMLVFEIALLIIFWGSLVLFSIGAPATCLNALLFFAIKSFRRSPSAYYIVGQSFADVIILLIILLEIVSAISVSISSIDCKLMIFSIQMAISVAMSFLCLSAFDRWACTSQTAGIRQLSSTYVARFLFPIPFIICSLVNILFLVYCDLIPPINICWFTNDIFMRIGTLVLSPILTVFLPLIVLIMFGLLTYRNIRFVTHIRHHANQARLSTREHQMTKMVLIQTLLCIFCSFPRAIFVIYAVATIDQSADRSFDQLAIVTLVDYSSQSVLCINFASSFYVFLLSSPRFRKTVQVYLKHQFHLGPNQVEPMNMGTTGKTLARR
ncbi:unnamed protein product [Rotaria magnacalcarata]|uniref:G-protein coupled receptors family 1 profile domain-containing protein n=2 Tax=Rotaria magnacalcarata TaxID=392030 RepID=A0A815LWY9_9BILA|nr:unnamed protein product [Rotaria magnacalcarata]